MKTDSIVPQIARAILIAFLLFLLLIVLGAFTAHVVVFQFAYHVAFGWALFLWKNVRAVSVNADVLVPGLFSYVVAGILIHVLGRAWFARRDRVWSLFTTFCLSLLLPVLFFIAFLIPGLLLQLRPMDSKESWTESSGRGSERSAHHITVRNHAQWMEYLMKEEGRGRYPAHLLSSEISYYGQDLIYPAAGLMSPLPSSFPLIIGDVFPDDAGSLRRWVMRADHEMVEIPAEDLDVWLARAVHMRGVSGGNKDGGDAGE